MKYAETVKPGFYFTKGDRCLYLTGTLKGNKWIDLTVPNPEWRSLMWTCISSDELKNSDHCVTNPTHIFLPV